MRHTISLFLIISLVAVTGCQRVYYGTMEKFGVHKRDLLVDRVEDARDAQQDAKEQFESALEKFSAIANFEPGQLGEIYEQLKTELATSESKANKVRKYVRDVENVAEALFAEWDEELLSYNNSRLRRSSETKLNKTIDRYEKLIGIMRRAEARIDPVLTAFRDQVLFLKHNLNAQAIASLQHEFAAVEADIESLIREMEASIAEANKFIGTVATK